MLEWYVFAESFGGNREIERRNVFAHGSFLESCQKNYRKNKTDKEAFLDRLRRDLLYYYWSKCEWEIIIAHWPRNDRYQDIKVDVYDQIMMNWHVFSEYVWENRDAFKVKRTRKKVLNA